MYKNKSTSRYITVKLQNNKGRDKLLKITRDKRQITYNGISFTHKKNRFF